MAEKTITKKVIHHGVKIQQHGAKGAITEILDGQRKRLEYMQTRHAQVGVAHLVVTLPDDAPIPEDNELIGDSVRAMRKTLQNRGVETQAGWVREVAHDRNDSKPHYHVGVLFNAHETQSAYAMASRLNALVTKRVGKPSSSCYVKSVTPSSDYQSEQNLKGASIMKIRRGKAGEAEQKNNALNWLSYHAKVATKENGKSIRCYGFSQLPKSPK